MRRPVESSYPKPRVVRNQGDSAARLEAGSAVLIRTKLKEWVALKRDWQHLLEICPDFPFLWGRVPISIGMTVRSFREGLASREKGRVALKV